MTLTMPKPFMQMRGLLEQGIKNAEQHFRQVVLDAQQQYEAANIDITVAVDGRVSDQAATRYAQRRVVLTSEGQAIKIAVQRAEQLLKEMIRRYTNQRSGALLFSVTSFLFRDGSRTPIDLMGVLEDFKPGDMIMVMPTAPYYPMVNSSVAKAHRYGFMKRAAMRVRNELNISSRSSNLRVFVARDRAIEQHVPIYKSRGIRKKPGGGIPDNAGLPVIMIRYKRGQRF